MFKKILIANRGEIVIRIIRSCEELGIKTAAVYSEADRNSLHVMLAGEAYDIGPAPSKFSYLNIEKIIQTAKEAKADAIHPGYGFLSESADFALACKKAGLHFIGPHPDIIRQMGDKIQARKFMKSLNVPVPPGTDKPLENIEQALKTAEKLGYPVILKAGAGGGGKGIRTIHRAKDLPQAFKSCEMEAESFFNNKAVFMEKLIQNPKHIEVQILGDSHGNVLHLFERECSIQRRHQKLIEESPSPNLPKKIKEEIIKTAVKIAKKIKYTNAGTVEFIYDSKENKFYFLEMNTRLQVEHPVTELITGVDIVREQIFITAGRPLKISQNDIQQSGHAMELRICAEDPKTFLPSPGRIRRCRLPQGPFVRVDGYCYMGYKVPIHYDPMLAKLICWGKDRTDCRNKIKRALAEFSLTGIKTNISFHRKILEQTEFLNGSYTNNFIEEMTAQKNKKEFIRFVDDKVFLIAAVIQAYKQYKKPREPGKHSAWRKKARMEGLRS